MFLNFVRLGAKPGATLRLIVIFTAKYREEKSQSYAKYIVIFRFINY